MPQHLDSVDGNNSVAASTPDKTLVGRCLRALEVLERHGVTCISLVMRFKDGRSRETFTHEPCFYDDVRIPKKSGTEVVIAWIVVLNTISDAIREAISGTDYEDADFLVSVAMRRSDQPGSWSIKNCEITAMLDLLDPGEVLKLP